MSVYGLPRTPVSNQDLTFMYGWHPLGAYITIPWGAGASRGGPEGRFCEFSKYILDLA